MPPQAAESREAEATCTWRRWAWHRFFSELSMIKSVIGITYPKIKFFLRAGSRQENPASHPPQGGGWLGSAHENQAVENVLLVKPPEVASIGFMKKKIFYTALGMIK